MPPSFVPNFRGDRGERRVPSTREREDEFRRMYAAELASDVMERRREKAIENREWFPQDRSTEAARMQELSAHFYDELVRAEQESSKAMAAGSHRSSFKVGVSESAEHLSSTIGERFRALRSGKSKPREG